MKPELVVMAAGMGSRYGGLKQLEPVGPNGEILLDYAVYDAWQAGFERVIFVLHSDFEQTFREQVGKKIERHLEVAYVCQSVDDVPATVGRAYDRSKPWGTGHALWTAREKISSNFAVINADDFYGRETFQHLCRFLSQAADSEDKYHYALAGFPLGNTLSSFGDVSRGVCEVSAEGLLDHIVEYSRVRAADNGGAEYSPDDGENWYSLPADAIVSMNCWGFTSSIMDVLQDAFSRFVQEKGDDPKAEFFLPTVVDDLIRRDKATVRVLNTSEPWFGITYEQDREPVRREIEDRIRRQRYPAPLW